jgi:predicted nucleotidyltransferase
MDNKIKPELNSILSELRCSCEFIYGTRLKQLLLYGSHARGDAEEYSDIDILVILEGNVNPGDEISRTGDVVAELSLRYNTVISCGFMDEEGFKIRNGPYLRNIRKEGVFI